MLTQRVVLAILAAAATAACGDPRRSMSDMTPPPGDAQHGRVVFVDMRCHACHRVAGENLDLPVADPPVPVVLGGRIARVMTDGALADSIVNPSHRIAYQTSTGVRSGTLSRMPDYTRTMTVRELADLVAYLQTKYELADPSVFSHY
jgi:mono/diheme cytochrome c family protein